MAAGNEGVRTMNEHRRRWAPAVRTVLAFLLCPLLPGALLGLKFLVGGFPHVFLWALGLAAALGYPPAFLLGLPAHLFLRARGWTGLVVYAALGSVLGLAGIVLPLLTGLGTPGPDDPPGVSSGAELLPLLAVCGVFASTAFWFITRPDRAYRPKTPAAATASAARPDG